ncbi:unnamed protein product [Caenorhabditis nigoni]
MQSLSSMLAPLNGNDVNNSQQGETANLQTPLSISIPLNEYEVPGLQHAAEDPFLGNQVNPMWPINYQQQPLLRSKSPEMDALAALNAEVGNQYTYQMFDSEGASNSSYHFGMESDPRTVYDKIMFAAVDPAPYQDRYYQCAYGQSQSQRVAIRHKLDDNDQDGGPDMKRHCVEAPRLGNEYSVIVPNTSVFGNGANKG